MKHIYIQCFHSSLRGYICYFNLELLGSKLCKSDQGGKRCESRQKCSNAHEGKEDVVCLICDTLSVLN